MTDEPPEDSGDIAADDKEATPSGPPEKMGPAFYASLALIGILVLMVVILNYPAAKANAGMELSRSTWTLESLVDSTGIIIPARSGTEVTAQFDREGRISGNAGCNRYGATYQTRDYTINFTDTSSTKMFCPEPGVMDQESAFLADLSAVTSFRVSGSTLKMFNAAGKTVLVFAPA
jgi:heat shock protein HslJ